MKAPLDVAANKLYSDSKGLHSELSQAIS